VSAIALTGRPQNPELANLTQMVVKTIMASMIRASVAGNGAQSARLPQDPKSLEQALAPMFRGSDPRARSLRQAFGRQTSRTSAAIRGFDFASNKSVLQQQVEKTSTNLSDSLVKSLTQPGSPQQVNAAIAQAFRFRHLAGFPDNGSTAPQPVRQAKELRLLINRVHCVQRVGWEASDWDGIDVIQCGGLGFDSTLDSPPPATSPSTAHFRKVPKFLVDKFPQDGRIQSYNPAKVFCKWDLTASGVWPRAFVGIIAFAEQDSGDEFPKLLQDIWKLLEPQVLKAVQELALAGVGAIAGGILGSALPVWGNIIAIVVGGLIGAFVGNVIDTLSDDILETSDTPVTFMLPSPSDTIGGKVKTDVFTAEYVRPGMPGIYHVDYFWELVY
jgi:hypothetical protein